MRNCSQSKVRSKTEFTPDQLPHNRKEVLCDLLKLQWTKLLLCGLLMLLLLVPFFLVDGMERAAVLYLDSNDAFTDEEMIVNVYMVQNLFAILRIPCFLLLATGLSGLIRVIRQYAWGENVFFSTDFMIGIRSNLRQMLLLGGVASAVYALCAIAFHTALITTEVWLAAGLMVPSGIALIVGVPWVAYALVCISIYENQFKNIMLISMMVGAKTAGKTLLATVCCYGLLIVRAVVAWLVPNAVVGTACGIVIALLLPTMMLAWYLFALDRLDEKVNQTFYPELVGRGTYPIDLETADLS